METKQPEAGAAMPLALTKKLKRWEYTASVEKMRPLLENWKRMSEEMVRELYIAREVLTSQKGQRKYPGADDYILYTWSDYCDEIGLSRQAANYWLNKFTPKELSGTGKDVLLLEAPKKQIDPAARALFESRIAEAIRTGKRPDDFTEAEEAELRRRMANARYEELSLRWNAGRIKDHTKTDYFADAMQRSKDIRNFDLGNQEQKLAQLDVFEHISAYLATFKDIETRALAAFNIALKVRNIVNELAELNFQLRDDIPGQAEDAGNGV